MEVICDMAIPNLLIYLFGATTLEYVQFLFSVLVAKINPNWKHFSGEKGIPRGSLHLHPSSTIDPSCHCLTALSVSLKHSGHFGRARKQFDDTFLDTFER